MMEDGKSMYILYSHSPKMVAFYGNKSWKMNQLKDLCIR